MNSDEFLQVKKLGLENLMVPYSAEKSVQVIYNPVNFLYYVDIMGNLLSNHKLHNYAKQDQKGIIKYFQQRQTFDISGFFNLFR